MQKIYYDTVNNKEVIDISGVKDEASVKSEFGLDDTTQVLEVDVDTGETYYYGSGTLKKKTKAGRDAEKAVKAAEKAAKKQAKGDAAQAVLGLNDADWAVVKKALG